MSALAIGSGIVALVVGLAGPADRLAGLDLPAGAEVIAAALDVFDESDETATAPLRLQKGDRVTVRDVEPAGWLTIDPPPGAFCWIEQPAIGVASPDARARVIVPSTVVRSGHPTAAMPGSARVELKQGAVVRLLNRPALTLGQGRQSRTWRAIAPPPGDMRHVRTAGVRFDLKTGPATSLSQPAPTAEVRAGYSPPGDSHPILPEIADALARIEATHTAILRAPVEQWHFEGVRASYEALLRNVTDSASGNAIRARIAVVDRHEAIAVDARRIETLLERSRRRDAALLLDQRRLADAQKPQTRAYDMEGLIQASSRKVAGQKVFALIGRDGMTEAYLDIPPGIDVRKLLTHRVGVRGSVNYNEALRARVITVRDLEPLDGESDEW